MDNGFQSEPFSLPFDIYALIEPKTKEDYLALLDETILMAEQLEEMWDDLINRMKR